MSVNGLEELAKTDRIEWVIFVIGAGISLCICLPIMLYWSYKTYKYRHQSFVRSRHPRILFFNCALSCICVIERVVALMHDLYIFQYDTVIRNVVYIFIFGLYIHSYLLRHWLLFYDLGYREAEVNIRWEHEMNLVGSHWFIDHRRNCGNATFMMSFLSCFFILIFTALFIFYLFGSEFYWRISISIYGVLLSLLFIIISYKISTINNTGKMKREVFYAGMILLIGSILYSIIINIIHIKPTILSVLAWFISTMVPFVLHLMSTWYQIKCNAASRKRSIYQQRQMEMLFDKLPAKKLTLREILKNVEGFRLFIRHLIKDLCVENLIYLSVMIQFKILYSFIVLKELEDRKTRTALVEEDESSEEEPDFSRERKLGDSRQVSIRRVKTYSNASSRNDYIWDDDDEYNEVYGWSMELPQVFGLADKDKIKSTDAYTDPNELILRMYEESLGIYTRFIMVNAKDEVNISHKMRLSIKKYFENEELLNPMTNGVYPTRRSQSKDSKGSGKGSGSLPNPMAAAGSSYSHESMNIRLCTQDSLHDEDSIDVDSNSAVSDENNVVADFAKKSIKKGSMSQTEEHKEDGHTRRGSTMRQLQQRLNRKGSRMRSVISTSPNDNYLSLNWIQRFKLFDRACDSIEKLLRIDSYGKFRESPDYLVYCEILSKKKMSTSSIIRSTSNFVGNIVHRRGFSADKMKVGDVVTDVHSDTMEEQET